MHASVERYLIPKTVSIALLLFGVRKICKGAVLASEVCQEETSFHDYRPIIEKSIQFDIQTPLNQ